MWPRGMRLEEARGAARRKFGNGTFIHEEIVRMTSLEFLETTWQDLIHALRAMRKNTAFAATAVLTLALGIGGNTAMFTVIRSVLLKPLAYRDPDRVVQISGGATSVRFEELRAGARSYTEMGAYRGGLQNITLSGGAEPEVLKGASVSANFLSILEMEPVLGRAFRPEEDTGGALGVLLARWSLIGIAHMIALELPRAGEIQLDGLVLGFAVLLSIGTGVLFGLVPSLSASRPDLAAVLRASGEGASSTGKKRVALGLGARYALVIGQVALSMVLLIGAALLMQSLARLYGVNPGFNPSHLLTLHISLPPARYQAEQKQAAFFDELAWRVQSMPGIRSAAATLTLPFTGFARTPVQLANQPPQPLNRRPLAIIQAVTPAYFRTLEIPLKRGREFSARDDASASLTAIISESLARVLWPAYPDGLDPVGQRILIGPKADPVEIVGVVADIHQVLGANPWPGVYRPLDQYPIVNASFAVRTAGDPLQVVHAVRDQVLAIDRDQPASAFKTMEDLMESEGSQRRLILTLLGCFAGAALLLAVIGIYGVIAYSVAQRTQEVGIRRALGAQDMDIVRLVVGQGLVRDALRVRKVDRRRRSDWALTRVMTRLLFHTSATDPLAFVGIALMFVIVALAASYIPARRAARIDPPTALRIG